MENHSNGPKFQNHFWIFGTTGDYHIHNLVLICEFPMPSNYQAFHWVLGQVVQR
jgi:hypothetical protein